MVRWQNQEDPGYATPSSSDEEVDEESSEKLPYVEHSLQNAKYQYPNEEHHFPSLGSKNNETVVLSKEHCGNNTNVWARQKCGRGDLKDRTNPGACVWTEAAKHTRVDPDFDAFSLYSRRNQNRVMNYQSGEAGADNWQNRNRLCQQYSHPPTKKRQDESMWTKPNPKWSDKGSTTASSTLESIRARLESFLSPKNPKQRPMLPPKTPSFTYPATRDGSRYHGLLFSSLPNGVDDYSEQLDEPRESFSPIPVRQRNYFPDELLARDHLRKGWISENWNEHRNPSNYTTGDVDHLGRKLFPSPNPSLSSDNWHGNNSNLYRERVL